MTTATSRSGSFQLPAASLPTQLTTFIGREKEIAAVADLLASARLLTITGVGGAGKTRLANQVATRVAPRYEVTGWVDLASLSDAALVPQLVANTLGFREEGGRSAAETMVNRVCEVATLVVLDNCEHLVDACAAIAETLLKSCPRIRILATSREALGVSGEQAWLVPPLTLPSASADCEIVRASEAGQLFLERARAVLPGFALDKTNAAAVAQICRRLDGIPLAIELAAARVRVLAPDQIAARLDDAFKVLSGGGRSSVPRHRTLRETIDWSHALLSPSEAVLFRRLAVFVGSFSLDAIEGICASATDDSVLDLLSALVDKSLVIMESTGSEARYRLLETLRQYGHERLEAAGEVAELRRRHAEFFAHLVVDRERATFGGAGDLDWGDRLVAEEGNLRAVSDWAEETHEYRLLLQLTAALHWHWFTRGHFRDWWDKLQLALRHANQATRLEAGKAYVAAATTAYWLGKLDLIVPHARRATELLRGEGDHFQLAYALCALGIGQTFSDPAAAEPLLAEATMVAREIDPHYALPVFTLYWHGRYELMRGNLEAAERLLTEALVMGRGSHRTTAVAHPATMLGITVALRGRVEEGSQLLKEGLQIHTANSDIMGCLWAIEGLARLADKTNDAKRAVALLAGVRDERARIGAPWTPHENTLFHADSLPPQRRDLNELIALAMETGAAPMYLTPLPPPLKKRADEATGRSLSVQALGPLQIARSGEALDRNAWASAKPRELLLLLLAHPKGRTKEQVGLAFWPDASAEQVRNNFHVTLHRLRKTLGDPQWVVLRGEQYALDPAAVIDFDATKFEKEVTAGMAGLKKGEEERKLESALALYRGDFLENENAGDWHLEMRDRLRLKYVEGLTLLAESRMKQERWADAADAWRRLITTDELDERAYRGLMTAHAKLGERSQVQQVFKRLEQLLQKQLEAKPEAETVQLFKRLISA